MSNCKLLWIARRKHQHLQTAGKYHYLGKRDGVPQQERERERERERETAGQKERERGREDTVPAKMYDMLKLHAKCGMQHISPTLIYVNHTSVFEADNIYKNPPQMSFYLYFLLFLFRSRAPPMTLLTAGVITALPDPSCPRQLQTCARLMQGWVASDGCPPPPPQQKSWLSR